MPKNNYDDDEDDDLLMALQSMEPCGNCGAEGAKIPCMSGCGEVFYCSRECNMHHASAHRLRCRNLRCSKFNDSESESDSDDSDEYETDSSAEYETDSDEDEEEEEEEEEEVKPKKKKGKKKGRGRSKSRRVNSSRSVESSGSTLSRKVSLDADVEKRIEEKIMKRLKKQEEARIAQAIEARMRAEKANWRDDEMNRIIMEMRERFQNEMSSTTFWAALAKKNGLEVDSQEMITLQKSMEHSFLASNPQSEDKMAAPLSAEEAAAAGVAAIDGSTEATVSRTRSVSKESSWNNACPAFDALRVVVWKHSFLPRLRFSADDTTSIWNTVTKLDADESFAHICVGDKLLSINGRAIDDSVGTEDDLNDVFAAYASPIIMKFESGDPSPENCKIHDYTVTWSNGPLGVTLKDDCATQKIPIVNRLTKKAGSVAVKQNIAIGDVLVAINNIDTIQLGCSLSMSILKKVQLPAKLRFRGVGGPSPASVSNNAPAPQAPPRSSVTVSRQPSALKPENGNISVDERAPSVMNFSMSMSRPSKYTVNWGEGPLGLTIIPGLNEGDLPVIKKVTGTGNSVGIDKAQVGDFLESMNGIETTTMHFENVVSYLKTAPKPVLLRFRAALDDDDARGPSSYRSNGTALSAKSDASYDNAPVHMSPPEPAPMPHHTTEVVRQVSREAPSDVYKVVWGSGALGLTIDAKPHSAGVQFLVHFNRTLCLSVPSCSATVSRLASFIQQCEGVPASLLDLYVNGRKLDVSSHVPSFPTIIRARLRGGLRGRKGGFGAMLRSMGKASGAKATTDFGACRDLHGRRLRHVNQEVAMHKWRQDGEARAKREKDGVEEREILEEETPSGIPGWYLATPSWAEGIKKSYMKRRRNTVLCTNWQKVRERQSPPPGAPRWWGCPRGRNCDFAHGEDELRGEGLTEFKRAKREETQRVKQQELQDYVDFEQEMPDDVLDAIKSGLRRRKSKAKAKMEQQEEDARVLPPDATTYISVRSAQHPPPVVEKWLKLVGEGSEEDACASVGTTFKHGLCELRGRGNFGTAAARHCCALTKGKWYYEVRLVTAGVVQIGWADSTFEANSETGDGVGDHERSWAYDGARQVKWNNGKDEQYATDDSWSKNDVIGCLLDLDEGIVLFTRNGVDLGVAFRNVKHTSSGQGFFPAISVEQTEILLVNIGSQPFLYEAPGFEPVIDGLQAEAEDESTTVATTTATSSSAIQKQAKANPSTNTKTEKRQFAKEPEKKKLPTEPPIDLMKFETVESLEALGLERLKLELSRRDLKCGGNLTERAARLLSVRGKTWEDIDAKLKIKKNSSV